LKHNDGAAIYFAVPSSFVFRNSKMYSKVMSFKVPDRFLIDRHCNFRIHSQQFVRSVMIKNGIDLSESYSIVGHYIRSSNAAIFSLKGENSIK